MAEGLLKPVQASVKRTEVVPPSGIDLNKRQQGEILSLLSDYENFPKDLLQYLPYGLQDYGFFPPELIDGLLKEAELEKYSQQRKRNDPDARRLNPEFDRQNISGDIYEELGRFDEPARIYKFTQPETLEALAKMMGAQAYYSPSRDEIVVPFQGKNAQSHEYMHRGVKKSPLTGPNVENKFYRKYHPGLTREQEHLYIHSKTTPEMLETIRKKEYPQMEKKEFLKYVSNIEKEVDRYRKDQAKKTLEELNKIFWYYSKLYFGIILWQKKSKKKQSR